MKKRIRILAAAVLAVLVLASSAGAAGVSCRSASAYSVWKLVARCQAGLQQSCAAVPQTAAQTGTQTAVQTGTQEAAQTGAGSAAASPAGSAASGYAAQVVQLVNAIRQQYGLSALTENTALSAVAQAKAQDMRDNHYFSHTSPTYGTPFEMMTSFGIRYQTAGENIAMGYSSPQAVVDAWMNSAGHRANILSASYTQIGVGYTADGGYWSQMFIG